MKPIVAIVGRPNVGKSTLFNRIAGERISIVEDTPGVTRDRIYFEAEWLNYKFTMIDTGGLDPDSEDILTKQVFEQAEIALEMADVILFVVDVKTGITDDDFQVANILRKTKKPIVLAVNKVDNFAKSELEVYEFYSLGLADPIPVSAGQALGLGELLDEIVKNFSNLLQEKEEEDIIKVAIVGKPNVGKSSLINKILGEDRSIVSDIPGTTRDAIDTYYERDNQKYVFIDTAGMRKKNKIKDKIERYSTIRSIAAIDRADVCLIMIDAENGITEQDTKIAGLVHESGKASIIVVNKWDKIQKDNKTTQKYTKELENVFVYMPYTPKIFISALTGQRVYKLFDLINIVSQNSTLRISTGMLNDVLIEAMSMSPPSSDKGRQLRIYYVTQVSIKPPTFILFVNNVDLLHFSYKRYIENQIRDAFGFVGTPIRFIVRNRKDD